MTDALAPVLEGGVPPPPPSIDNEPSLAGIQPIPTKKVLMIVNSFIINTVDFLNKLNAVSEHKLRQVQQHIQRVEITLALLEGKLDSVPWLSQSSEAHAAGNLPPPSAASTAASSPTNGSSSIPTAPSNDSSPPPPPAPSTSPSPPPPPTLLLKDDERYKKYFKMLAMGVPKQALRGKIAADGLDPEVIDRDPEGPAPEGGEVRGGSGGGGGGDSSGSDSGSGSDSD